MSKLKIQASLISVLLIFLCNNLLFSVSIEKGEIDESSFIIVSGDLNTINAGDEKTHESKKKQGKQPETGCAASFLPGCGHFYAGNIGLGVFFLIARLGALGGGIYYLINEGQVFDPDAEFNIFTGVDERWSKGPLEHDDKYGYMLLGGYGALMIVEGITSYFSIKKQILKKSQSGIRIRFTENSAGLCYNF